MDQLIAADNGIDFIVLADELMHQKEQSASIWRKIDHGINAGRINPTISVSVH
jgi:hypothetical protein